jgi:hypothetical protein
MIRLAHRKVAGRGTKEDPEGGFALFKRAADKGSDTAAAFAGMLLLRGEGAPKDFARAEKLLLRASKSKDETAAVQASGVLGAAYIEQKRDQAKGVELLTFAHEHGNILATSMLGMCAVRGEGMPKDEAKGAEYHRKAAEGGHVPAMLRLGAMLLAGKGVPKDLDEARVWLTKAAEAGDETAKTLLKGMK